MKSQTFGVTHSYEASFKTLQDMLTTDKNKLGNSVSRHKVGKNYYYY